MDTWEYAQACRIAKSHCPGLRLSGTLISSALQTPHEELQRSPLTALSSPRLPALAKWAVKVALELPAATPHRARITLAVHSTVMRSGFGIIGERQSAIIEASLKMSAARRYLLHSGSIELPSLCANSTVAILPAESWKIESNSAPVAVAVASPTPTPGKIVSDMGAKGHLVWMHLVEQHGWQADRPPCLLNFVEHPNTS